jgi:hypothetical protein
MEDTDKLNDILHAYSNLHQFPPSKEIKEAKKNLIQAIVTITKRLSEGSK